MSVKSVVTAFVSFLGHHVDDLTATGSALTELLGALPVNAQTREHIANMIAQVETSATNVSEWLTNLAAGDFSLDNDTVTVKESDIENALSAIIAEGSLNSAISSAVAQWMILNPPSAPSNDGPVSIPGIAPTKVETTDSTGA